MPRTHTHGAARISAAIVGAPLAAVLVALALSAKIPAESDIRLLIGEISVFPLIIFGSCAALLSRSGLRAWGGCALAAALSLITLVFAR